MDKNDPAWARMSLRRKVRDLRSEHFQLRRLSHPDDIDRMMEIEAELDHEVGKLHEFTLASEFDAEPSWRSAFTCCPNCGLRIRNTKQSISNHHNSVRCEVRRGDFQAEWHRVAGSSYLADVWPPAHKKRGPNIRIRRGQPDVGGHTRTYFRTPRDDVRLEVVIDALKAYRRQQACTYREALRALLQLPSSEVEELANLEKRSASSSIDNRNNWCCPWMAGQIWKHVNGEGSKI